MSEARHSSASVFIVESGGCLFRRSLAVIARKDAFRRFRPDGRGRLRERVAPMVVGWTNMSDGGHFHVCQNFLRCCRWKLLGNRVPGGLERMAAMRVPRAPGSVISGGSHRGGPLGEQRRRAGIPSQCEGNGCSSPQLCCFATQVGGVYWCRLQLCSAYRSNLVQTRTRSKQQVHKHQYLAAQLHRTNVHEHAVISLTKAIFD